MHVLLKSQIFCHGKRYFGGDQTFYHRVVCKVQKHGNVICNAAFLKGMPEEISNVMFDAHSGKYNGKLFVGILTEGSLFYNLCRQLVVGQTISGKDRKFLSADQCGESVYS